MKMNMLKSGILTGMALVMMTAASNARPMHGMRQNQPGQEMQSGGPMHSELNLTEEQQKQITALRVAHQKEIQPLRNDIAIKQAELQKYRSADKPDMVQINSTIDAIGKLKTEIQKKSVAHQLAVRALLTDEQKLIFDAKGPRGGKGGKGGKGGYGGNGGNGGGGCNGGCGGRGPGHMMM
jgi:Spy/CpxP family protein refolding chaperone